MVAANSDKMIDKNDVSIEEIPRAIAKEMIETNHYSKKFPQAVKAYLGCYYKGELMGCIIYSIPANPYSFNFVEEINNGEGYELSRMWTDDCVPQNFESCCIGKSIRYMRKKFPELKGVISYADSHFGHVGKIYVASNWKFIGMTKPERRYILPSGELITRRGLGRKNGESEKEHRVRILELGAKEFKSEPKYKYFYKL